MLNNDTLAQLRALKQQLSAQKQPAATQPAPKPRPAKAAPPVPTKNLVAGTVKGSQGRFGFVTLDDGRDLYLAPEQMQRVFPDDRVEVEIVANGDGKPTALVEKLVNSPLREFTGHYVVRDNAHFIEPDLPRLTRWLFVPPRLRGKAVHGDWVRGSIARHPFSDGKPQARLDAVIGAPDSAGIEWRYALARHRLTDGTPEFTAADLLQPDWDARRDLRELPFITIDGADTQDMDDALYAERNGDGWTLTVAIADPDAWIAPGSALERAAAARAITTYMPGHTVPMLPDELANGSFSLRPDEDRLALVCTLQIGADGTIGSYSFSEARIRSRARLDYTEVAACLQGEVTPAPAWAGVAAELNALAGALQGQRRRDHVPMPDQPDYRHILDADGHIVAIQRQDKTAAHRLVEECMVATNRCAADFLKDDAAVFVGHNGFRSERRDNVKKLLTEQLPQLQDADIGTRAGYTAVLQALEHSDNPLPLRAILLRSLERSQLHGRAAEHFGLGLPCYTTITSPIRKYSDLLAHRAIKAKLRGATAPALAEPLLAQLQEQNDRARQASWLAERWLECRHLQQQLQGQPADTLLTGTICHVNSSGFTVRLPDTGIEGFVDLRGTGEKFSFDQVYLRLSSAARQFQLEQDVAVSVAAIDMTKRSIAFQLPPLPVAAAPADATAAGAAPANAAATTDTTPA